MPDKIGSFDIDAVTAGDCRELIAGLPDESIDVLVTSPPYWGQRLSKGHGVEDDPRDYVQRMADIFISFLPKLKQTGIVWSGYALHSRLPHILWLAGPPAA